MTDPDSTNAKAADNKQAGLFIVSAPSGAGKSTLCQAARRRLPELVYSISSTTRPPRPGEAHGVDYFFLCRAEFEENIRQGRLAEWAKVHGHYYGTSADFISRHLQSGRPVLLDIDVAGMQQIIEKFPDAITIFIMPPSLEELGRRLEKRGTDDMRSMEKRLENAKEEISKKGLYRYVIVNDCLSEATENFCRIIEKHWHSAGGQG
ncbi:MAG: guanylate kinase [Desulfosalsimonadaceae bacterium]